MQRRLVFLFCLFNTLFFEAGATKQRPLIAIHGHITETSDYCGGAMPSKEKLALLKTPHALAQKTIYIKKGKANSSSSVVLKKVMTDEEGNFTVMLKAGEDYIFVEEWKAHPFDMPADTEFTHWDPVCLEERYRAADYTMRVKLSGNPIVNINYHTPCFFKPYCGTYTGPLPP